MNTRTAIAERQESLPGVPEPTSMLAMIYRAASDPSVDAGKMEKLLDMAIRLEDRQAKAAYNRDMLLVKPKLPVIDRKGRIEVREKDASGKRTGDLTQSTPYAKWEDIDEAITPILNEHGFTLTFRTGNTAVLSHREGHSEESAMTLPLDTSGSKNNVQAAGSSTKYAMRYTASALLNIRTKGEDDDGKKGGDPGTITEEQAEQLLSMLTRDKADVPGFCKYMGVANILELPTKDYPRAIEVINTRSQKVKAKEKT